MPTIYDYELDKDIDSHVEDDDYKKKRDVIGRKPFALDYVSLLGNKTDEAGNRIIDRENVAKVVEILKDEAFQREYPYAGAEAQNIAAGLTDILEAEGISYELVAKSLQDIQNGKTGKPVSFKTRARLARQLSKVGGCDFDVEVRKIPDMRWLVPANSLANYKEGDWKRDKKTYQNMPPRDGESGFVTPQYVKTRDGKEVNLAVEVAEKLKARLEDLKKSEKNLSEEYVSFYEEVIAAYESGDWKNIAELNGKVTSMDAIAAAFDIRKAAANPIYAPDYYYPEGVILKVRHKDIPDPRPELDDKILTSDEWNQGLMATKAEAEFFQRGVKLAEGVIVKALEDTLGTEFKKDEFGEMILDEQEEYIINSMNAAQRSKFNALVAQNVKSLAEMLPPNALVLMAKGTDMTLAKDKNMSSDLKNNLEGHRKILVNAMMHQVELYDGKTITNLDNVAGVYDGAMAMMEYLDNNYKAIMGSDLTSDQKNKINNLRTMLNNQIKLYDQHEKLDGVDKDSVKSYTKNLEEIYEKQVDDTISKDDFETRLDAIDHDLKSDLWDKLEFEDSTDPDGNAVKGEDVKKTFAEVVMLKAAQRAAAEAVANPKAKLEDLYKQNLEEVMLEEAGYLLAAQTGAMTVDSTKPLADKKRDVLDFLAKGTKSGGKFKISKDAQAGYFAKTMNYESLFVNRLATKFKNRSAKVLFKIHDRFNKIDNTLIKRYGATYQIPRTILGNAMRNLPWTAANSLVRIAAFSQVGTPWGMACIAGYAAYNLGATAIRMIHNYKKNKKADSSLTPWKYVKRNWSAIGLTLVGAAVTTVPGLKHAGKFFEKAAEFMTNAHMLDVTPTMNPLKMTNASMGMMAVGGLDSFLRVVKANRRNGDKFWSAVGKALASTTMSSAVNLGVGVGVSQGLNAVVENVHYNLAGDIKTTHNDVKDDSFLEGSPNHDPDATYNSEPVSLADIKSDMSSDDQKTFDELLQKVADNRDNASIEKLNEFLNQHGISAHKWSVPETTPEWQVPGSIEYSEGVVEHAQEIMQQWYAGHKDVLEARVAEIEQYNKDHGTNINPYRYLLIAHDAGALAPTDTVNYNQDGPNVNTEGNHYVLTDKWAHDFKVDENGVHALHDCGKNGVPIISEASAKAFEEIEGRELIGKYNQVGFVEGVKHQNDGHLGYNGKSDDPSTSTPRHSSATSTIDPNTGEKGNIWGTYVNHGGIFDKEDPIALRFDEHNVEKQYVMPLGYVSDLYVAGKTVVLAKPMGNNGLKEEKNRGFEDIKQAETSDTPSKSDTPRKDSGEEKSSDDAPKKKNFFKKLAEKIKGKGK